MMKPYVTKVNLLKPPPIYSNNKPRESYNVLVLQVRHTDTLIPFGQPKRSGTQYNSLILRKYVKSRVEKLSSSKVVSES